MMKFITSGGDPKQAEGARKTLTFAIIGLMVVVFSFAIVNLVAKTTGVGCLKISSLSLTKCVPDTNACGKSDHHGTCSSGRSCIEFPSGSGNYSCHSI